MGIKNPYNKWLDSIRESQEDWFRRDIKSAIANTKSKKWVKLSYISKEYAKYASTKKVDMHEVYAVDVSDLNIKSYLEQIKKELTAEGYNIIIEKRLLNNDVNLLVNSITIIF